MMRTYPNPPRALLLVALTVLVLAALAACSKQSTPIPPTATVAVSAPTQSGAARIVEAPTELQKLEAGKPIAQAAETLPVANDSEPLPCAGQPACANLLVTQSGRPSRVGFTAQGLRASAVAAVPTEGTRWVIDTGTPSPDGSWVAYTSIGYETGGPVYLQNIQSGEWVNLVKEMNAHLAEGQPEFPLDLVWDVIGWFPDSQRLMIGPSDLSSVVVVDRASYAAQLIGFPGGGRGGRMFVSLDPGGRSFLFLGENEAGQQTISSYDLASGQISVLQAVAYEAGFLSHPRISPDGMRIAYMVQRGQPEAGLTYAMTLLEREGGQPKQLVEGNLSMTAPSWSPDGVYIAFTRNDAAPLLTIAADAPPPDPQGNVWIVSLKDGAQTQVTFIDGLARSPVWATDGKTLAFVTHTGEVGMANIDQPGQVWQAAGPSELPELTSVFFVP